MTKLIASAVVLVALAILIMMNASYRSTVNLFGARFENVSVIVIAIAGFVLGVAYSLLLYVLNFFKKQARQSHAKKAETLKQKEVDLARREQIVTQAQKQVDSGGPSQSEAAPGGAAPEASAAVGQPAAERPAGLLGKLGRKKGAKKGR